MEAVVLVIHLIVALGIIAVVLLQRSEGGGLGVGGGGGLGNFASQRATANALTRVTTWLGTAFVITSLTLAVLATHRSAEQSGSILDVKAPEAAVTLDEAKAVVEKSMAGMKEMAEKPAADDAADTIAKDEKTAEDTGTDAEKTDEKTDEKPGDKAAE